MQDYSHLPCIGDKLYLFLTGTKPKALQQRMAKYGHLAKPDLGFEYDMLSYSMGSGSKSLHDVHHLLLQEDRLRIEQWLSNNNPYQQNNDLVHGVDAQGEYLGLVSREQAVTALLAPPPSDGAHYLWSFTQAKWLRQ